MAITTSGVQQSEIGPRYDVALGYSTDGVTAAMTGYLLSAGTTWSEKTDITDEEHVVQIASPSSSDRFGRYPTISQGDWSGGERQLYFNNASQYYTTDGVVDVTTPGQLKLLPSGQNVALPTGFTILDRAPMATDGAIVLLGGQSGGVPAVWIPGSSAPAAIPGAVGTVSDLDAFDAYFYAVTGNGIWRFQASLLVGNPPLLVGLQQITSDAASALYQTLAFVDGTLYYPSSTQRVLMGANAALGANPGTVEFTVPALEGNIAAVTADTSGVLIATSNTPATAQNAGETVIRRYSGTVPPPIVARFLGTVTRMRCVNGVTYILSSVGSNSQYTLHSLDGSTLTLLDDTRFALSDFQSKVSRGSEEFDSHLWDDGRFLYIGWPGLAGLRYDTTNGAISHWGGGPVAGFTPATHRIVNGAELVVNHSLMSGTPQVVTLTVWNGALTIGSLTTSFFDATVPLISKRWTAIEFQLARALPAGASIQAAYLLDQQTAFSAPITAVATASTYTVYLPPGTVAHRIKFQITLTAGSGVSPVIAFYDVRFTLGRVLEFTVSCYDKLTLRDSAEDITTGIDKLSVIANIRRLAGGDAVLFVPSQTAGPDYVEQINATLVDYNDTRSRPAAREGQDMPFDIEADVQLTFAEQL